MLFDFVMLIASGLARYAPGIGPPAAGLIAGLVVVLRLAERTVIG